MDKKYYVTRIDRKTGDKVYKKSKNLDIWSKDKSVCWKYSKQGAKQITNRLNEWERKVYFEHFDYDFEEE